MKYTIPCSWEMYGELTIEADSLEEACLKAEEDSAGLPEEKHYVDGSFEVDRDLAEEMNKEKQNGNYS